MLAELMTADELLMVIVCAVGAFVVVRHVLGLVQPDASNREPSDPPEQGPR